MKKKNMMKSLALAALYLVTAGGAMVHAAPPSIPASIMGTVTVDGTLLKAATSGDYTFMVTDSSGIVFEDAFGGMAECTGLDGSNQYNITIPIGGTAGAQTGGAAVIHVYQDGTELSVTNPSGGAFTVGDSGSITEINLTVSSSDQGGGGTGPGTGTTTISGGSSSLTVDFIGSPTIGSRPLTVNFIGMCNGSISSYLWSFGDQGTSTEQNPSHVYSRFGNFTVTLTVTGADGSSKSEIKPNYVMVTPACMFLSALENIDDIETLRVLRDSFLGNTFGIMIATLYYRNTDEVSAMLEDNAVLRDRLRALVSRNIQTVRLLSATGSSTVTDSALQEVIEFLHDVKAQGSPQLQGDLDIVLAGINNGYLLHAFGIKKD